ncbi:MULTISPECIES: DUF2953 domain-containing protein [unclassified Paenibacillus]|uniref:DUF2953 domain-containing protein n=1 Tax=unclassified Paenibacillus TaxID=185978 RepID=UPI001AE0F111|nr:MULTISPECIES: DUF2953 domain-containing protein [unclassified Paenibacillus]MBP1155198.1 hypothetical protein [Paenibacillus sp. PvP091]MBP1169418.1 hypothetical protein [Paenibacillus sp. PvR098]MBP2440446.1 hypothetical protein [Paenibacillus sp. PvP052]
MVWAWAAGMIGVLIMILALSRVRIRITLTHQGDNDEILFNFRALLGLLNVNYNIPMLHFKNWAEGLELKMEQVNAKAHHLIKDQKKQINVEKIKEAYENIQILLKNCFHFHEWLLGTVRRIHCTQLNWKTSVGIGDAPETAFLVGALWGIKTSIIGFLSRYIRLDIQPHLQVMPAFNQKLLLIEGVCTLQIRLCHIISAVFRLLLRILKVKGGLRAWRSVLLPSETAEST